MNPARKLPLTTVIVATPQTGASGTFVILDVLSSVGRSWEVLHGCTPGPLPFRSRLLSLDGQPYRAPNGITIQPHGRLDEFPVPDIVIVPELILDIDVGLPESYAPIAAWIRNAYEQGATVTSVCSGSMLLAAAGLLDGEDAANHWGFCDLMNRQFPHVRVRKERILIPAGEGHRIITAGGASSWNDLLLYLIGRFVSQEEARRVAKVFLINTHDQGQLPFAGLTACRKHEDQVVAAAQMWIADNYREPNPVAAMAERSRMTERGFFSRFKRATGLAPIEYVQFLRIEEAKHLLETTDLAVDEVALEVGYAEPSSFRRLFRKMVGISPSSYRRQRL